MEARKRGARGVGASLRAAATWRTCLRHSRNPPARGRLWISLGASLLLIPTEATSQLLIRIKENRPTHKKADTTCRREAATPIRPPTSFFSPAVQISHEGVIVRLNGR
jgi:hypothetical protein